MHAAADAVALSLPPQLFSTSILMHCVLNNASLKRWFIWAQWMYVFFDYFLAPCTLLCLGESLPITSYWITETDAAEIQCVLCCVVSRDSLLNLSVSLKCPEQSQQHANKEDWKGHSPTDPRVRATVPKLLLRILKSDVSLRDSSMEKQTDLSLTVAAFKN